MNIYLAARYGRLAEMQEYRRQLEAAGHWVVSRWLGNDPDLPEPLADVSEVAITPSQRLQLAAWANEDVGDLVNDTEMFVLFTEPPGVPGAERGGRMVELGIALGLGCWVAIVGPRENLLCWHPDVQVYPDWPTCRDAIGLAVDGDGD